jgi:glyoxylase-like metal-dependent hydrolase (beta-lactamase superfamily II)
MREVADGIWAIDGLKMGRSYLIEDRDTLTLIDTSSAPAAEGILDAISRLHREPRHLKTIVATHYHHDHTGNVATLVERTGATLCVHAAEAPYVDGRERRMAMKGPLGSFAPKPERIQYSLTVDRLLQSGDTLEAAGGLRVIHAPGHTPGHIALHAPARSVLFAGDAFMNLLGLRLPPAMSSHDMEQARQSIQRLAELHFEVALPGHGSPILSRASEKLAMWTKRWL